MVMGWAGGSVGLRMTIAQVVIGGDVGAAVVRLRSLEMMLG